MKKSIQPEDIDAILPQTQCGLCGYGGCLPYANALAFEKAAINLCPPGGVKTLRDIADLLGQDASSYIEEMEAKTKQPSVVTIREEECIGCTKCIQACPVDAIIGSAKQMHTVITAECTGCDLCIPACPVDCIDIVALATNSLDEKRDHARDRFNARQLRLSKIKIKSIPTVETKIGSQKQYLLDAIKRARANKN